MIKKRQFLGVLPFTGVIHQTPQRVDMTATRGIIWERPERFMANTPFGQMEIGKGDWVLYFPRGAVYVVKDADIEALRQPRETIFDKVLQFLKKR